MWLSQLVLVNIGLSGLSKAQLLNIHVCQKHFDRYQFDGMGNRLAHCYPSLFTEKEKLHEIPLSSLGARGAKIPRGIRDVCHPFDMSDGEFQSLWRISKPMAIYMVEKLAEDLEPQTSDGLPAHLKVIQGKPWLMTPILHAEANMIMSHYEMVIIKKLPG